MRWRRRPTFSLRTRLTLWYVATITAALVTGAGFVLVVASRSLHSELDAALDARVQAAAADMREALLALDPGLALGARRAPLPAGSAVRDATARLIVAEGDYPRPNTSSEADLRSQWRAGARHATVIDTKGQAFRVRGTVVTRPGAEPLLVEVATSTRPIERRLRNIAAGLATAIVVVLIVAAVGSLGTVKRALAPLEAIIDRVQDIQRHGPHQRLDVAADSAEFDGLIRKLNEMLAGIEGSVRSSRRFAADASHELQTPLAAMRTVVESCLMDPTTPSAHARMAEDVLAEIERCSAVVRDLRLLALADAGALLTSVETIDVADLTSDCGEIARTLAEPHGVGVELDVHDRPLVRGSAIHLRRVVLNLMTNATRYSATGSVVRIGVESAAHEARVTVADTGCGIAPEDFPHIFEPFYRADPARARDTGGTGLGLAIAEQVARAHGGRIDVTSMPGIGSTFVLVLPAVVESAGVSDGSSGEGDESTEALNRHRDIPSLPPPASAPRGQ